MKKKFLATLLAMAMALLVVPFALAADTNDNTITEMLDFTSEPVETAGNGWSWDNATKTLTLSGFNMKVKYTSSISGRTFGIQLPAGSTIVLEEGTENSIEIVTGTNVNGGTYGIYCQGDLTIKGTGSLKVVTGDMQKASVGICAHGAITIRDATWDVQSGAAIYNTGLSAGIYAGLYVGRYNKGEDAQGSPVIMENAEVTARGGATAQQGDSYGICSLGSVIISGGTVEAYGGDPTSNHSVSTVGIFVDSNNTDEKVVEIKDGAVVRAEGGTVPFVEGETGNSGSVSSGIMCSATNKYANVDIIIDHASLNATSDTAHKSVAVHTSGAVSITEAEVTLTAGEAKGTEDGQMSAGLECYDDLIIIDSEVDATAGTAAKQSFGIYTESTVAVGGDSTVLATGKNVTDANGSSYGIYTTYRDVTVAPTSTVTATNGDGESSINGEIKEAVAQIGDMPYSSLQDAIDDAKEGATVEILTHHTITEAVEITKDIAIDGNEYVITAENAGFYIKGDLEHFAVQDLTLEGVELAEGATANEGSTGPWMGIGTYNGCYGVADLELTNVTIDGFSYGLYFGQNPAGNTTPINENDVVVTANDLTIQNCYIKGAYFEKLTDSTFTNCRFTDNGTDPSKVESDGNKTWMSGVDINLKNGQYKDIVFENCTFEGNGSNSGTALHIKARDDSTNYGSDTTLNGVTVTGCTFANNNKPNGKDEPIILGEPGKSNKTPVNVSIQPNMAFTNNLATTGDGAAAVVTFDSKGGSAVATQIVKAGNFTLPVAAPTRPGHAFLGWLSSANNQTYQPSDDVTISGDTIFTALWQYIPPADPSYQITIPAAANGTVTVSPTSAKEDQVVTITVTPNSGYELTALTVTDRSGNRVTVTANPDGTYRFVMPASQVTVSAVFAPAQLPFTDVTEANWYYDEVYYVWANGLMQGTSASTFGPNVDTTRAMVVTILWRLEGEPASGYDMDYSDVAGGAWYAGAVRWATEHGIVNGSEGQFYPGGTVTREQLAAMLYRYAQYKGYDLTGGDLSGFADAGAVSGWAETSLAWAVGQGLFQGSDSQVDPQGSAIRAQTAAILMRFMENVVN